MCSIFGIIGNFNGKVNVATEILRNLAQQSFARGQDSWGIISSSGKQLKGLHKEDVSSIEVERSEKWYIGNTRSEPTTEYVVAKDFFDIQPFMFNDWVVSHNGTIANDKKLVDKYGWAMNTKIDSAVLPRLLNQYSGDEVKDFLGEIEGSFAMAFAKVNCKSVYLACNYKPIYMGYFLEGGFIVFASQPDFIKNSYPSANTHPLKVWSIQKVAPYSCVSVDIELNISLECKKQSIPNKDSKALVVCSGGLDRTVAATVASQRYKEIELVHFLYDCRAQEKEKEAIIKIADALKCNYKFIETDFWKNTAKGSRLTDPNAVIAQGEEGIEIAKEWCYARNTVFLSMAVAYAESIGYNKVVLGNNIEEAGAFPDNDPELISKFNEMMANVVGDNVQMEIVEPVGGLNKKEIVALGIKIGAPIQHTWSCYEAGEQPCNNCGPCNLKRKAFVMNGYILSQDQTFWSPDWDHENYSHYTGAKPIEVTHGL